MTITRDLRRARTDKPFLKWAYLRTLIFLKMMVSCNKKITEIDEEMTVLIRTNKPRVIFKINVITVAIPR